MKVSDPQRLFILFCLLWQPVAGFAAPTQLTAAKEKKLHSVEEQAVLLKEVASSKKKEHLSLEDCLRFAFKHNFDIKEARQEIRRGRGEKREEQATALPKLLAGAEYEQIDPDSLSSLDGDSFGTDENWTSRLELQQPLFLGGEGLARWEKGRLLELAAMAGYDVVLNAVTFAVKESFYNALLARANVSVQQESVELLEEQLVLSRNRFQAGIIPRFNVLRAEVEVANARTPLIKARNDLRLALERLGLVLGKGARDAAKVQPAVRIQGELSFHSPGYDLPTAVRKALQNRPELQQLKLLHRAEEEGVDIERSNYFPHLLAFAGYGWESSRFSEGLSEVDQGWRLGLRAEWDIFDGMRTQGKVQQAQASSTTAKIRLQERKKSVTVEVRRALSDLLEAEQLVKASKKVVEQAEEGLRQATARLESGAGQQIDVLDTRVALTEARTNEVVALHSFNVALARTDQATGKFYVKR